MIKQSFRNGLPPVSKRFYSLVEMQEENKMKRLSLLAMLILAIALCAAAQTKTEKPAPSKNAEDEKAIQAMLAVSGKGWAARDAKLASSIYAEDAQWMNAFGRRKNGRAEIEEFLKWLFSHPGEKNTKSANTPDVPRESSIKFIRPDVAVIYSYREVIGQMSDSGKEMPKRKIHVTQIATKERGKWLIANEVIMDERESLADK